MAGNGARIFKPEKQPWRKGVKKAVRKKRKNADDASRPLNSKS